MLWSLTNYSSLFSGCLQVLFKNKKYKIILLKRIKIIGQNAFIIFIVCEIFSFSTFLRLSEINICFVLFPRSKKDAKIREEASDIGKKNTCVVTCWFCLFFLFSKFPLENVISHPLTLRHITEQDSETINRIRSRRFLLFISFLVSFVCEGRTITHAFRCCTGTDKFADNTDCHL